MTTKRTSLHDICDLSAIGRHDNPIRLDTLLQKSFHEPIRPAREDAVKTLLLLVDPQLDFMEGGALGVPGSIGDMERTIRFLDRQMESITKIVVSMDAHHPFQIFHPCWWTGRNGDPPDPFSVITLESVEAGDWIPVLFHQESLDYVRHLETNRRPPLVIWPYHCLAGTIGSAMENQLANLVYFHSAARRTQVHTVVKGEDPLSEMYGIIRPEQDDGSSINWPLLHRLASYDRIYIAGQAKSHCVLESLKQILSLAEEISSPGNRIWLLEDCMSSIPGFEDATENALQELEERYHLHRVRSVDI